MMEGNHTLRKRIGHKLRKEDTSVIILEIIGKMADHKGYMRLSFNLYCFDISSL